MNNQFTIPKAIIGLWQIADMEKGGNTLDPVATAKLMTPYVNAGFTTFDMADHYGSAEIIAGDEALSSTGIVSFTTKFLLVLHTLHPTRQP